MFTTKQLNLQKYASKNFTGLITLPHLGGTFMVAPEKYNKAIRQIYRMDAVEDYVTFTNQFPTVEAVKSEDSFYEWDIETQRYRNIPLKDWYIEDLSKPAQVGANRQQWFMVFGEQFFDENDVIAGENPNDFAVMIKNVEADGSDFIYTCELVNNNLLLSIPSTEFFVGSLWSKDYNLQSTTLSDKGTKPYFSTPGKLRNTTSFMRMEYTVPGNMIEIGKNYPIEIPFQMTDKNGNVKEVRAWTNYYDMVAEEEFRQQFARLMMYGKSNWTDKDIILNKDDKTKWTIKSGAGFYEQIAPSNSHPYSFFDLDGMIEIAIDMGVGRLEGSMRMLDFDTGEYGLMQASRAIEAKSTQYTPNFYQDRIYKAGAPANSGVQMPLGYGGQFIEYKAFNGVQVKLNLRRFMDDRVRFKKSHPSGKGSTESYRYTAINYGGDAGVKRVVKAGITETIGYRPGLRDPFSPGGTGTPKVMVTKVDGYEFIRAKWGGLIVENPFAIVDFPYLTED